MTSSTERVVLELPSELAATVRAAVESGDFGSENEFVAALVRLYREAGGVEKDEDIETLRAFVAEGLADANAGRLRHADEVYETVLSRISAARAAASS